LRLADADPGERLRMGTAGRGYVAREHNMERLGDRFAAILPCNSPAE
jgi:hypothetical protein